MFLFLHFLGETWLKTDYLTSTFYLSQFSFLYSGSEKNKETKNPQTKYQNLRMTTYYSKNSDFVYPVLT